MNSRVIMCRAITCAALVVFALACPSLATAAVGRTPVSYDVDNTGQATYAIPIVAPKGQGGLAPQISLVYSHRNTNTLYGIGWGLSGLSTIERCGKTWAQDGVTGGVDLADTDRFCLDGNQLKRAAGPYGGDGSEYATEIETYSRVRSYASGKSGFIPTQGPKWFEVYGKDGLIYEYGTTEDSRIEVQGTTIPRAWALQKIRDRSGNEITFSYTKDTLNGAYRIDHIDWGSNSNSAPTASHHITFVFEDKPSGEMDPGYYEGGKLKEIKRLKQIEVSSLGTVFRVYKLNYDGALSSAGHRRLANVTECIDVALTNCLAPTSFTYTGGTKGLTTESASTNTVTTASSALPIDVNGDGRTDLVYSSSTVSGSGTWRVAFANTSGGFNASVDTGITNTNFTQAIVIDYNSDGLQDVLVPYSGGTWWVLQGTTSGLAAPVNTSAPASGAGGNAITRDVNGDGLEDLVWLNPADPASVEWRARVAGGAFAAGTAYLYGPFPGDGVAAAGPLAGDWVVRGQRSPDLDGDGRPDVLINIVIDGLYYWSLGILGNGQLFGTDLAPVANARFLDLNGDGYSDIVYTSGANWYYRFSTGVTFGAPVPGPLIGTQTAAQAIVLDYDSDGFDDLLVPDGANWYYMRSTGEALSNAQSTTLSAGASVAYAGDVNGDGLDDVLYVKTTNVLAYRPHAGVRPDLLNITTDGYGNTVDFDYIPITQGSYTKYATAAFPNQDYQGPLDVVSLYRASTLIDANKYTKTFVYWGAVVNRQGRGFTGFSSRRVEDSRTGRFEFDYYHQTFPYIGITAQHDELQPGAANRSSQWVGAWGALTLNPLGLTYEARMFPYVTQSTAKSWEVGGTQNGQQISQSVATNYVDAYGTPYDVTTVTTEMATANGVQSGATYTQHTVHTLLNNTTDWCLGRPTQTQQSNSHSQYGGSATTRTFGRTWETGKCRLTQEVIEPTGGPLRATRDIAYDDTLTPGFGNVTSETVKGFNPDGSAMPDRVTGIGYDATGRFATSVTNALSQVTTLTYSSPAYIALGLPDRETDPNGLQITWQYDEFGRKTRESQPAPGATAPYTTWSYANCAPNCVNTNNQLLVTATDFNEANTAIADRRFYLDKADRALVTRDKLLGGTYSRVDRQYDSRGNLYRQSEPCAFGAVTTTCTYWNTFTYDTLNRPTLAQRPVSSTDATLQSVTTYYEGLKTRVTDPLTQPMYAPATVTNVLGQLARTIDTAGYYQNFDYDAFGNPVRVVDSLGTTQQSNTFNLRGQKTASTDLNMGSWTFEFNSLGEMLRVRDAKTIAPNWTTQMTYDRLGRLWTRQDVAEGVTSTWNWGVSAASKNIGRLESLTTSNASYSESYTFDTYGRPATRSIVSDATYQIDYGYNNEGRLATLTYPTSTGGYRLKLQYDYQNGQLLRVKDFNAPTTVFWLANTTNARGQVTQETLGNGLITNRSIDAVTGWVSTVQSGPSGTPTSIQNLSYLWDKVGNLTQRQDIRQSLTESFYYDGLYRLDYSMFKVGAGTPSMNLDMAYDATGNITSKSDVGSYTYSATKKNAVIAAGSNVYDYDANGNAIYRETAANTISWYSFNQPNVITRSGATNQFWYDPGRQRWKNAYVSAGVTDTTVYIGDLIEKWSRSSSGLTEWRHYISANGQPVALYTRQAGSGSANILRYFLGDHQGSVETLATSAGGVYVRESFTAFGQRRGATGWTLPLPTGDAALIGDASRRGYTFHESLGGAGLNNMNGRMQDPIIGRFLSADPIIDGSANTQGWNRYAYVQNRPLSRSDPSGFCAGNCHTANPNCHGSCSSNYVGGAPGSEHSAIVAAGRAGYTQISWSLWETEVSDRPGKGRGTDVWGIRADGSENLLAHYDGWIDFARAVNLALGAPSWASSFDDAAGIAWLLSPITEGASIPFALALSGAASVGHASAGDAGAATLSAIGALPLGARGTTVLGKFPDYIKVADELGAKRFNIPTSVWNRMSSAEQWTANQKFLDRAIARGDDILLSNPIRNINDVTGAFRQELDYLIGNGFQLSADGARLSR